MSRNARHLYRLVMDDVGPLHEGARIADIGCGHGTFLCMYADRYPGVRAFGLDQSAELINFAKNQCGEAGVSVAFMVGDIHNAPLPPDDFDVMVSCSSIYLWHDPVRVLDRLYAALKAGGRLLVYDELPARSAKEIRQALFDQRLYGLGLPAYTEVELRDFALSSRFKYADIEIDNLIIRMEMIK